MILGEIENINGIDNPNITRTSPVLHLCFQSYRNYIDAFIDHPKPIVALIQGPAVGVAVTVLGLCDLVYASDKVCSQCLCVCVCRGREAYSIDYML